ncbi:APC membrane recruitment protein 2 [Acanthochromis polyacanthus]|uniref:APC membrane recruitment protein 2 n=1 Tax=Acanthochromis polyacanthus TaxID=80966 RepID=UPI002234D359|nr:APC membrane recruitment protein 2 [Acanthochromis polyacanthus]
MDVQTENTDPPPCESQPSGKIRKGFKLFGKRKPGNIFSIRSKGDGNNKSPVIRSNTLDGLSETPAPDSEQESDKEKGQELSEGEREQADEEPLGEDGVLAAAHARTSISSASSAKSLSFLSLLRGGRRGVGDRQVQTVSQPTGRQRRGLKGLFSNVKFRSKDKEDKEEVPPSPLLMSSRANSVEIIKEDLTLTPKSQPRSLDSDETESYEPTKSLATPDSAATSPSKTPQVTTVSKTNEHVPPSPTSEPPMVPGDTSLSCLLADISSLLTFDSITGGGDIMADVEAEWGKASSAISPVLSEVTSSSTSLFSTPTLSSPLTSTSVSTAATAKPSPVTVPMTASTQSFTSLTKTTSTLSPISKPSTIITTFTKSSTLTTSSVKLSSDSAPATEPSTSIKIKSTPAPTVTKPSTTPVTLASLSAPTSSHLTTIKSTTSSTSAATTAPPNTPATVVKAPSASPTLTSTASKLASEIAEPPQMISSVSKPSPVATLPPVSAKPPPVAHTSPITAAITQPPTAKLDSASSSNLQTSTSYKPFLMTAGEFKAPVTVSLPSTVTTKPSPAPVILSKMTTAPTSTTSADSVSLSKPAPTSTPVDLNKTPPLPVRAPDLCSSSTFTSSKTQPSPASVPTPSSTSLDKILPAAKPAPAPVSLDKMPPTPTTISAPTSHAVAFTASPTPPILGQITVSHPKAPPAPAQIPVPVSKDLPPPAQMHVSQTKAPPAPAQIPVSVSKAPPAPAQVPLSVSKDPLASAQMQIPQSKAPPAPAQIPVSVSKAPPAPAQVPLSVSKDPLASAQMQIPQSKAPPAPAQIPVSVATGPPAPICIPTSVSKEPVSQPKAQPAPTTAPCPVTSPPLTPAPCPSEAPASAKLRGSGLASVDGQLASSNITGAQRVQAVSSKTEELHNEPPREKKMPQVKPSGLSKIPVVGGGRATKLPVRDNQHADNELNRDPPTPVLEEERPHFNSHDAGSKDKISAVEANVPTSKHIQEESQQIQPPKVLSSSARDSKIPVKHGAQSHTASQIPQKEAPRTKIPVSKVPVRRVGNKPAGTGGSTQMRK